MVDFRQNRQEDDLAMVERYVTRLESLSHVLAWGIPLSSTHLRITHIELPRCDINFEVHEGMDGTFQLHLEENIEMKASNW